MERLEFLIHVDAEHGEGPCWDDRNQQLYWVDIHKKNVHMYDPALNSNCSIHVGQQVKAVVLQQNGSLLLALENGFYSYDLKSGVMGFIFDPEEHLPNSRFNDGKCDGFGRFWAGTMAYDFQEGAAALYVMDTNRSVRKVIPNVTISNGLAWSTDHKTMYYIDSPKQCVMAYDYDLETGTLTRGRKVVSIPKEEGLPDGMTSDSEGMLWVAHFFGGQVTRWNPKTGKKIDAFRLPVANVTSCAFGGEDLTDLYITTSRAGLSQEELKQQPLAGGLFRLRTNVHGIPSHRFGV